MISCLVRAKKWVGFTQDIAKKLVYAEGMDVSIIDDVSEWQLSLLSKYRAVFDDAASIVGAPQH